MLINTYKAYIATKHDGSPVIARRISSSGWAWFTVGRSGQIISPEIPEEHLKNFSMIVQGSMREGWGGRIIEAYKASWPEDGMERLEEMNWFMWLRRTEGEYFCLSKYLGKLGIKL